MNTAKVVVGVLGGLAVGALVGILFAPDKGSETRKKIAKKGSDSMNDVKDKFEDLLNSFTENFESTKEEIQKLYEQGKKYTEDLKIKS